MRADVVKPKLQADVPKRGEVMRFRTALDKIGSLGENGRAGIGCPHVAQLETCCY